MYERPGVLSFVLWLWWAQAPSTHTHSCCNNSPLPLYRQLSLRGGQTHLAPEVIVDDGSKTVALSADPTRSPARGWLSPRTVSEYNQETGARRGTEDQAADEVAEIDRRESGVGEIEAGPRLRCTVVEPREKHTATIIWLHGRGHDPDDLIRGDMPAVLAAPWFKFVFVHSPRGSGSGGTAGSASGDRNEGGDVMSGGGESERGGRWLPTEHSAIAEMGNLHRLVTGLHRLIRQETSGDKGVPSQRLVLAGHGEGAVVALAAALSCRQTLGGLISLSAWFPRVLAGWCDGQSAGGLSVSYAARRLAVLMCHGLADVTVPVKEARDASARLAECGVNVEAKEYAVLAHDFCVAELLDVQRFLLRSVPRVERLLSHKKNPHEMQGIATRRADWGLTKMRPWNARYLVLREHVLYAYASEEDYIARKKALEEWDLDAVSYVASDKKVSAERIVCMSFKRMCGIHPLKKH